MFSGMDTDMLVKAMTIKQQSKVDALNARKQQAEWKRDMLTDFNNKLRVFRDTYGSVLGEGNLMSRGAFTSHRVHMASNTGVSIVASAGAKEGGYNIRVEQIATAATMQSGKLTDRTTGLSAAEINSTAVRNLSALTNGGFTSETISFTINGVDFNFSSSATLKHVMDEVNKSAAGVTMAYTQTFDSVTITSNTMGEYNEDNPNARKAIEFSDAGGFLRHLGLTDEVSGQVANGQDAIVYFNGETTARRLDTNNITLDGIQMTFMRPTGESGVDYTLETDFKPAVDRVRKMVESFNALIKELDAAYNQRPNRSFRPLTEEQRNEFSEKEIDNWESKAREGLLHRDNTLGRLLNSMRGLLSRTFGSYGNLSSIGIATGRYVPKEAVQLEFDEEKFLEALKADPDRVHSLIAAPATDNGGGFMIQLNRAMDDYVNAIRGRDLQNLNNDIHNHTKNIKEQEDKLTEISERYYLQYAKLETALGQMQSQQNQMASLFGWNNQF
jgi:flagellar hook-associated protein 2